MVNQQLNSLGLDGWLIYDFRHTNPVGLDYLGIAPDAHLSRRFFYWIPAEGEPVRIVAAIERDQFSQLPGRELVYRSWHELHAALKQCVTGRVAMEFSPDIPYLSLVDGGTIDLIRSMGVEVVSSSALLATKRLTDDQLESHRRAADIAAEAIERAWEWITIHLKAGGSVTEYDVQDFLMGEFIAFGCETDSPPQVSVNANSANPHYQPTEENSAQIKNGDWLLIDLWCKQTEPGSIWGDLTKVACLGEPSRAQVEVFEVVKRARERALEVVARGDVQGWEVDAACREVVVAAGYGEYFVHRTGHDIGTDMHGRGTHLDDFETHDTRKIQKSSCFSIEPGIYLSGKFGVRLECDVLVTANGQIEVTGRPQQEIEVIG